MHNVSMRGVAIERDSTESSNFSDASNRIHLSDTYYSPEKMTYAKPRPRREIQGDNNITRVLLRVDSDAHTLSLTVALHFESIEAPGLCES